MFENLSVFENRYEELNMKLYDPAVAADRNLYRDLMKEHKEIEPIVEKYRALKKAEASLEDAEAILNDSEADKELRQMASDEMSAAKSDIESISEELKILLLPRDPNDDRSVIVEIRGGAGGEESALFAADLRRIESAKFPVLVHVIGTKGQDFFGRALDKRALFPEDGHRALLRTHRGRRKLIGAVEGKRG